MKQTYNKELEKTKIELQQKFNLLDIDELNVLNDIASKETKQTCNNFIENWRKQGLLKGYFGTKCNEIYRRSRVRNTDILELYIYYCFMMYENDVRPDEEKTFRDDSNYYFRLGQEQVGVQPKDMKQGLYDMLMGTPCCNGYTLDEYKEAKALQSTYQIHRQATMQIQQGQKPKVKDMEAELDKQERERLNIRQVVGRGLVISGIIDMILIGINNMSIVEGIKEAVPTQEDVKVRFIAVIDDKTTPMCESLHGQIFKVNGENEFTRWSDSHKQMRKYKCYGLVLGLNEPPITDHFHFCRSSIEYVK